MFKVTLTACIAGDPRKAWNGTTGETDTEHVPDDVWQDQSHDFDTLETAVEWIRGLDPRVTTHVVLVYVEDGQEPREIFVKDRGDDLDKVTTDPPEPEIDPSLRGLDQGPPPVPMAAQ